MKIQKGHYVPKELITSEAIHEAVVKCFVAAGFSDDRPFFGEHQNMLCCHAGLAVSCNGKILWGQNGVSANNPLTLQQLFTAENGIAWPDFAVSIQANDTAVWFDDGKQQKEQFKVISSVKSLWNTGNGVILATRQQKDKEVNEALDKAVIEHNGLWPCEDGEVLCCAQSLRKIANKDQFTQRAKELGFINGYRYGVEYDVNGVKPDLDGVKIEILNNSWKPARLCEGWNWALKNTIGAIIKFRVVDQRYKPHDTSYLKTPAVVAVKEVAQGYWWDYENAKFLQNPAVGTEILCSCSNDGAGTIMDKFSIPVQVIAIHDGKIIVCRSDGKTYFAVSQSEIAPLDHVTRKAELDKKRVIDAVVKSITEDKNSFIAEYEYWLDKKKPSGDCDDLQCKWLESRDYSECVDNLHFYISLAYDKGFIGLPDQK